MAVRQSSRVEVRIRPEQRAFLEGEIARRGITLSEWVREKVEEDQRRRDIEERVAAVERLGAMNVDWVPEDPDELEDMINEQDGILPDGEW